MHVLLLALNKQTKELSWTTPFLHSEAWESLVLSAHDPEFQYFLLDGRQFEMALIREGWSVIDANAKTVEVFAGKPTEAHPSGLRQGLKINYHSGILGNPE